MTRLTLLLVLAVIFATGLLMVFNTSSALLLGRSTATHGALLRHLLYGALAVAAGWGSMRLGYKRFLEQSPYWLLFITLLLLLVFCPGIGERRNGAARWISLGSLTCQPSEFAKVVIPLFAIYVRRYFYLLALPLSLIFLEPDNGSTLIICTTLLGLCFIAGVKLRYWLLPTLLLMLFGCWAALQLPYVAKRIEVYLHPDSDLLGRGHQPYQAKIAAGSGGLLGRGIGQSMQKFAYLPEAQNDYIAAIFAEECGFIGILLLIVLYAIIVAIGVVIAQRALDLEGAQVALVLTLLIAIQAFFNLGVVSGLLPSKGLNLPFFSQGGTSLIANGLVIGLLLDVEAPCVSFSQ